MSTPIFLEYDDERADLEAKDLLRRRIDAAAKRYYRWINSV
jgi:hypothetical protein